MRAGTTPGCLQLQNSWLPQHRLSQRLPFSRPFVRVISFGIASFSLYSRCWRCLFFDHNLQLYSSRVAKAPTRCRSRHCLIWLCAAVCGTIKVRPHTMKPQKTHCTDAKIHIGIDDLGDLRWDLARPILSKIQNPEQLVSDKTITSGRQIKRHVTDFSPFFTSAPSKKTALTSAITPPKSGAP